MVEAPSISVADFESLQQELLRLKQDNYDLQTELRQASAPSDKATSWTKLPNNLANKVSSSVKNSLARETLTSRESQLSMEIQTLQVQLESLHEAREKESREREEQMRQIKDVGNVETDEQGIPYLLKIQQQQSELDRLRDVVEAHEDTIRVLRLDAEMAPRRNSQCSVSSVTSKALKDENVALHNHQQTLENRLSEAMSESKDSFTMRCTIQSMGKKLNDYHQLLNEHKVKAARALTETNDRWAHERIPMLEEDILAHVIRSGVPAAFAHVDAPDSACDASARHTSSAGSTWTSPRLGVNDMVDQRSVEEYKKEVEALRVQVDDLKVEKQIVEKRADAKVKDLKEALRKKVESEKRTHQVQHFSLVSDDEDSNGPVLRAPWCAETTSSAPSRLPSSPPTPPTPPTPPSPPTEPTPPSISDALYVRKICELETLTEVLQRDLASARETEELLKEDVEHKRTLITHMLHNKSELPSTRGAADVLRGFFGVDKSSPDLEKALEESIADNIRLRDDIRVLSNQLRQYL